MGRNSNAQKDDVYTQRLRRLEQAVRELKINFSDTNIHGFVNCILRGWIVEGRFTDEYQQLIAQAHQEEERLRQEQIAREQALIDETESAHRAAAQDNSQQSTIVLDTSRLSIR